MNADRVRQLFGERHNHCYTSPIYREKVCGINQMLAARFKTKVPKRTTTKKA